MDHIGRRVARLRAERGWTQRELGERSGISREYVALVEGGFKRPGIDTLMKLAPAFGITLDALVAAEPAKEDAATVAA